MVNNSNIVNAMVKYHFSDGIHTLPCKVNKQTHEVFDISGKTQLVKELVEDDDFSFDSDEEATLFEVYEDLDYAEVEVDGKLYPFQILEMIDEALQDGGMNPIEEYSAVEKSGDYWEAVDGMSLTQCIRSWRWWELKNSIEHNRTAIADFIGANPGDAALFEQLVDETRQNQEENQSDFLAAVSDAVSSIEKSRDVKEWHGLTKETAERFAREFMAERNPGRWSGFGEVPESVSLDPLNFPINDIYPKGNKPALRMQLISVTYPSLHRVCECSIIEDGVDLWARRTLDSMTAGTVEDLVETVLYVARMYERSKCFERIYVNRIQMEKSEYDAILRHLNDPDSIDDEYRISDVVFAADNTTVSVLWEGNSKDGVSGTVTLAVNGKTVYATKSTKVFCNHWVIPYNGAEYHVLVDVLPKKTVLEETIYVSKPYAERIKKYLRGAEVQGDGSSLSKTAKFSDGFEMDIRCCGGKDDSWTEAILYDDTGREVVATEPCDGFTGCWELKDEDTNTVYRVHVMTKSNLN